MSDEVLERHARIEGTLNDPPKAFIFEMIQRGDFIKPGWWHWRCRREDPFGNVAYGYVQADPLGQVIMPDSFEEDP